MLITNGSQSGLTPISIDEVSAARARIDWVALRTPLIRFQDNDESDIHLKLENLQPTGSLQLVAAVGGWKDIGTLLKCYTRADSYTMLAVMGVAQRRSARSIQPTTTI